MTLEEAKSLLDKEYERAKNLDYVINPLAYALYQTWKKVDKAPRPQPDLNNKCGSCVWSVPSCAFSAKGTYGSYVECRCPDKVWRHEISKIKQRTTPKCRYYQKLQEESENGT